MGLKSAKGRDLLDRSQLRKRVNGGLDQGDWIVGPVGFGQDIVDSGRLADCSHSLARDNTSTSTGRNQQHFGRAVASPYLMRDAAFDQRYIDHAAAGRLLCLLNTWRNFIGFAIAPADLAFAIADDNHGGKTEAPTAFDNSRTSLDLDNPIKQAFG